MRPFAEVELAGASGHQCDRSRRPAASVAQRPRPAVGAAGPRRYSARGCRGRSSRCPGRGGRRRCGRSSPARGTRSTSWVAAARSAARWWVAETWRGSVEVDAEPVVPSAVAELEPADVGVAAVLLRPDVRDVAGRSTVESPAADPAAALPVRVRLVRPAPEPVERPRARARARGRCRRAARSSSWRRGPRPSPRRGSRRRRGACSAGSWAISRPVAGRRRSRGR